MANTASYYERKVKGSDALKKQSLQDYKVQGRKESALIAKEEEEDPFYRLMHGKSEALQSLDRDIEALSGDARRNARILQALQSVAKAFADAEKGKSGGAAYVM
jgi:hypothetical protein